MRAGGRIPDRAAPDPSGSKLPARRIPVLLLAAAGAAVCSARAAAPPPAPSVRSPARHVPAQRLLPAPRAGQERIESEHFLVRYDPARLSAERAEEARRLAEEGWRRCRERFGSEPAQRVHLDLTPAFLGATGFARPARPEARGAEEREPLIGVRYADLDYLGLTGEYVLTHEIAHIFSGALAGTSLGEGIADWAAGSFRGIPMRPWWGAALRDAGLWIEPDALFLTGEFDAWGEVDAVIRTAQYVESALLVRFLVERAGWETFRVFAAEYGRLRGPLESNDARRRAARRGRRPPPDAAAIRSLFERRFGSPWSDLRARWEAGLTADPAPPAQAERLVAGQQLYGAVRNYEMWLIEQRPAPPAAAREAVRSAFAEASRLLDAAGPAEALLALARARALVDRLRRPQDET